MASRALKSLSLPKYERLLPRVFPGATRIEIHDGNGVPYWSVQTAADRDQGPDAGSDQHADHAWSAYAPGVERCQLPSGLLRFRSPLRTRALGAIGWLVVAYRAGPSVPVMTAAEALGRSFADAKAILQEEIEIQAECDQLARELTERYEELNLVYSTHDHVEGFDEIHEALDRLVHNCVDYLNVSMAVLISRGRNVCLHTVQSGARFTDVDGLLELIGSTLYQRVEAETAAVVINPSDDIERRRTFAGRPENIVAQPIADEHGSMLGMLSVVSEDPQQMFSNSDRNLLEVMAKKAARILLTHHDPLTGLINRSGFEQALTAALGQARTRQARFCLLHIDIDQLHVVNDLLGHQQGDVLIGQVGNTMRRLVRDSDRLARLGGDDFAVLAGNCDVEQGRIIADKIREAVSSLKVISGNRQLDVSASIGVIAIDAETESIMQAMGAAEIACKAAKEDGRNRVMAYESQNTSLVRRSEEVEWVGRVQQALRDDAFELHCQPIIPLASNLWPEHFEILVRMRDEEGNIVMPGQFLPASERYQLMPQLDRWIVRNTLEILSTLWDSIKSTGSVFCINLSGQSLANPGFLSFVAEEVERSAVTNHKICFEITETAAISNIERAVEFISKLREMGCVFALDDFGAGLSSFGYLKSLPIDYLKIDGSIIKEISADKVSLSMVNSICNIAKTMGLATIAEFVVDEKTANILRDTGVDYTQGYYIGRPVPLSNITDRLQIKARSMAASA